jgi:acyl-CoA synthetase (AMP-forming)/AMP-acid ligase II
LESPEALGAPALVTWLDAVARARAQRPALRFGSATWTYAELWERAGRVAGELLARADFQQVPRVAVVGLNDPHYLAGYLGILRAGGTAVPLNHLLRPEEIAAQIAFARPACCLAGTTDVDRAAAVASACPVLELGSVGRASSGSLPAAGPAAEAMILLTSGSTGAPKGVVHTQGTLLHAALLIAAALPYAEDDVAVSFLPFFASIPEHVLPLLLVGGTLEILPRFDVDTVCDACSRSTTFDSVPTILARLLEAGDPEKLARLRWIMFASEPMPPALLHRWRTTFPGVAVAELYGMTEMLTITHATEACLAEEPRSVGVPFATSRVEILDPDGHALPPGADGEVVCASPARMRGYFDDPAATAAALTPDGAMRTGDLGRWDEKGRLHLTGRLKDVIITGGMNVAPVEIEAVACSHPDVMSAAVVGIPDVRWGETPVVVAVTRNGSAMAAAELLAFCRGELASFKRPTGAAVVDDLPLTGIGKLAKNELRDSILRGELRLVRSV